MGIVGRLDQYGSMLTGEFDDYSMSENLHLYSEEFNNAAWTKTNASITANATTAPDGTLTADALIENTTPSVGHSVIQNVTYVTGKTYTRSCYFKLYPGPITRWVRLQLGSGAVFGGDTYININLTNGTIASTVGSPSATSIINVGNGWYRASISKQYTGGGITSGPAISINSITGTSLYTNADGLSGVYIWGAQFEESPTVTDYTPTTTTAKTRVLPSTTNTNITGLSTYFSSGFSENVGVSTTLVANVFPPYDLVYDDFGGTLFGAGQGRYMRQNTDKSVIVYNEIDEVSDFYTRGIVRAGLVLDLDAGIDSSYPGTGTTWTDLSPYGNNGTLTNGPTFSSSNSGSLVFDGVDDFIDFTSDSNLLPTAGLTLSAWFKTSVADMWLINKTSSAGLDGYYLAGRSNTTMGFFVNNREVNTPSAINTGSWLNIVGTWTPSTSLLIYQNGIQVASNTTSIPASIITTSYTLEIGRRPNGPDYWNGNIAQVSIYNRALTAAEVKQNYDALKGRFGL